MNNKRQKNEEIVDEIKRLLSSKQTLSELYKNPENIENLTDALEKFGNFLANRLKIKTTQIRKFYESLKRIDLESSRKSEDEIRIEVLKLKPILAYAVGRQRNIRPFYEVINEAISRVKGKEDFKNFVELVKAIVAYHKFHGGREL